jgi:hypothetical protein
LCSQNTDHVANNRKLMLNGSDSEAPSRATVRLGVLLSMFGTAASGYESHASWSPRVGTHQAFVEINNKTDGIADGLLCPKPGSNTLTSTTNAMAMRDWLVRSH